MRRLIVIYFFIPTILFAQKKRQKERDEASFFLMQMNIFWPDLDSNGFKGRKIIDTAYYPNKQIKSIGSYAIYKGDKKSNFRVGSWTEFYENGQIKAKGDYQLQYYIACVSAMPRMFYNQYKINEWAYYYDNGQIKAKGIYLIDTAKFHGTGTGQPIKTSMITDEWLLYEIDGQKTNDRNKLITALDEPSYNL